MEMSESPSHTFGQDGFGLVEIVISMFLLALLSLALLPLLVQGLTQSKANSTLATATQLVNAQIEIVRSETTCSTLVGATFSVSDPQGVALNVTRNVGGTCPSTGYPITVPVGVTVTRADTGAVVSSASTLVFVLGS